MPEASGGRPEKWGMESSEGSFPQVSAKCWGLAEAVAGAIRGIPGLYMWPGMWPLHVAWVSSQNGGWVEAVTTMAASSCCSLHGPRPMEMALHCHLSQRERGWGKRFTAASRPGRFQSRHCFQWAAVTRSRVLWDTALGLSLGPSAHLPARSGSGRPWGEGRDPLPTTLSRGPLSGWLNKNSAS